MVACYFEHFPFVLFPISYLNDAFDVLLQALCLPLLLWSRVLQRLNSYGFTVAALVALASLKGFSLLSSAQFQLMMERALPLGPQSQCCLHDYKTRRDEIIQETRTLWQVSSSVVLLVCVALTMYPVYSLLRVWGTHLIGPDGSLHTEQAASPFFIGEILIVMMRNQNIIRPNTLIIFILQWNRVTADQPPPHCPPPAGSLLSFPSGPRWHSMSHYRSSKQTSVPASSCERAPSLIDSPDG